ncbi:MAG: preprotein translocase subunit SecG [Kiritimatiellae bacterium]|nr:preprotein translocase subunit SecG [Kiritimatiellia bacterium]
MEFLRIILLTFEGFCSLLLIGLILIQKSKGGGLGESFGSSMGESFFGARTGNVLTKATAILSIAFLANTLFLALLMANSHKKTLMSEAVSVPIAPPVSSQPLSPLTSPQTKALPPSPPIEQPGPIANDPSAFTPQPVEPIVPNPSP